MQADLHIHTTASDGRWSPEQIVSQVKKAGIGLFAVADHDTVESVPQVAGLVRGSGLAFIPAVEISTTANGQIVHILGYGIDPHDATLHSLLQENSARLRGFNDDTIMQMVQLGYPVDADEYASYSYDQSRGGWKSLNYLIDKGICHTPRDYFSQVMSKIEMPPPRFVAPSQASQAIRAAGGTPILAHPKALEDEGTETRDADLLARFGVAGVECFSSYHSETLAQEYVSFCRQHGLLITGGSDCHGGFVNRPLGKPYIARNELELGEIESGILV